MKKLYATTSTVLASILIGLVLAGGMGSALAGIFNPTASVDTSTFVTSGTLANYLPLVGGTLTGNLVGTSASLSVNFEVVGYASVSRLVFPHKATPSLTLNGSIAFDTASTSLKYFDGTNTVVLGEKDKCFTIPYKTPTATNEFGAVPFFDGGTLTQVSLNLASGSNAVGWNLKYGAPTAVTTAVFAANKSASSSASVVKYTSFSNSTPADGDVMNFVVTSSSATIEDISIGVCYRK